MCISSDKNKRKSGSIFVDAAISLPVFVLSFCLILSLIIQVGKENNAMSHMLAVSQAESKAEVVLGTIDCSDRVLFEEGHYLVYRPFCGENSSLDNDRVFIFPKAGIRYHINGCTTLKNGEVSTILTDAIRRKYSPCKICDPDELPNGAQVALYTDSAKIYHRTSCATITKSYECIPKSEAIERGYTPCQICQKE